MKIEHIPIPPAITSYIRRFWEFRRWHSSRGSEIVEFAVSVPLLVVLIVAVYDFGTAFTLKHKLTDAVREGVRVASSQHFPPDTASSCGAPASVCVIRDVVGSNLISNNIEDCGLSTASGSSSGSFAWTFTGSCTGLSLKIDRNSLNPNSGQLVDPFDPSPYRVENTTLTLIYPYEWRFNQAFKLLDRNANYLSSTITVTATMQNLE